MALLRLCLLFQILLPDMLISQPGVHTQGDTRYTAPKVERCFYLESQDLFRRANFPYMDLGLNFEFSFP